MSPPKPRAPSARAIGPPVRAQSARAGAMPIVRSRGSDYSCAVGADARRVSRHLAVEERLRFSVVMSIAVLGLVLASSCGPTQPRHGDEWDDDAAVLEPEIS